MCCFLFCFLKRSTSTSPTAQKQKVNGNFYTQDTMNLHHRWEKCAAVTHTGKAKPHGSTNTHQIVVSVVAFRAERRKKELVNLMNVWRAAENEAQVKKTTRWKSQTEEQRQTWIKKATCLTAGTVQQWGENQESSQAHTQHVSAATESTTAKNRNALRPIIVHLSEWGAHLCMRRSTRSPQHRHLLLAELVLAGSHMQHGDSDVLWRMQRTVVSIYCDGIRCCVSLMVCFLQCSQLCINPVVPVGKCCLSELNTMEKSLFTDSFRTLEFSLSKLA